MKSNPWLPLLLVLSATLGCMVAPTAFPPSPPVTEALPATAMVTQPPAETPTRTATTVPTQTPTSTPTIRPTQTPTSTRTNTPLPPLPDFDGSLSFGTGGAEDGFCQSAYDTTSTICFFFDDSRIGAPSADKTSIGITNPVEDSWITMVSPASPLEVVGRNYPAGSPVFVLLYAEIRDLSIPTPTAHPQLPDARYQLVNGQVAVADSSGWVHTTITVPWESGRKYLLIGSTNQDGNLQLEWSNGRPWKMDPWGVFWVRIDAASSCPGAPPQRMVVNRRGSVCTQRDTVRLRDQPARSASTIVFLPVGTQFTVLRGPSCADNWSWWQIQTDNGYSGWISEGGDNVDPYFICPLP